MDVRSFLPGGALLVALLFAACGADAGSDGADEAPPAADPPAATSLEITVWPEGEAAGEAVTYTLSCDPAAGDHPDPEGACAALRELGVGVFAPTPPDVMCTQQYGGPMEARIVGTVDGEPLDARLAYNDGCEIARWNAVEAIVPRTDGVLR
jgi:hypothetical protein